MADDPRVDRQCEAMALLGERTTVVLPVSSASTMVPSFDYLRVIGRIVESGLSCTSEDGIGGVHDVPSFGNSVVQVFDSTDVSASVTIVLQAPRHVPFLCTEYVVEDGCGSVWSGSVDIQRGCIANLEVNCTSSPR